MAYLAENIAQVGEAKNACLILWVNLMCNFVDRSIEKYATWKNEEDMPEEYGD
jgi:hypothetical protein